jgi:TolA-binding protein
MSRPILLVIALFAAALGKAQETRVILDADDRFHEAKEHFQQGRYSLAHPLFRDLRRNLRETDRVNRPLFADEVDFYAIACGLKNDETVAADDALALIRRDRQGSIARRMSFHLGEYRFRRGDYRDAIGLYQEADANELSDRELADMNFHRGYAHFTLGEFAQAKPLLNTVRQLPDHPNRPDADYYYGYICYSERRYREALEAFRKVEDHPEYGKAVPFYVASILYGQGRKDEALSYAESRMRNVSGEYRAQMNPFLGHAYFEKKQYARALPYLEATAAGPEKMTRGQLYELSYCQYEAGQYAKAAEGFTQLSSGTDSLMQSAMYLLGDASIRLGRKAEARNAFAFCAGNSSIPAQREVSAFNYAKLSYELGYQDIALNEFRRFLSVYPNSSYSAEARDLLVSLLAGTNNFREALDLIDGLKTPTDASRRLFPKVAYGRAMELVNEQRLPEAERLLDRVVKDPQAGVYASPARFWKGEVAYRGSRPDEAVRSFNEYLAAPSTLEEANTQNAHYGVGYAQLRMGNHRAALASFSKLTGDVRAASPALVQDAWLREADCHFMLRDFAKARGIYEKVVGYSWPAADYAQYQLAMMAGASRPADKVAQLLTFERRYPNSDLLPDVQMEIASAYLSDEKYKEAVPFLEKVLANRKAVGLRPRAHLRLGIAQYNLGNNAAALQSYQKLIRESPDAPEVEEALESARSIYVEEGRTADYSEFLKSAGRTVRRSQEDSLAWTVAENRYADKDMNGALTALNDYLQRFPDGSFKTDAHFLRGEVYNGRKDWKNAAADYATVAERGPGRYAERALQQAGRISYFELKDYPASERHFSRLKEITGKPEVRLDAMRGLLRSQYMQEKWNEAVPNAEELLKEKSLSADDRALAAMVQAKSLQASGRYAEALTRWRSVVSAGNAAFAAEARYSIAECHFLLNDMKNAEKAAMETINRSGSYDFWITKAYILLGDVFWKQKDYFNAKATLQSVVDNSRNEELKAKAKEKLEQVVREEKQNSRVGDGRP